MTFITWLAYVSTGCPGATLYLQDGRRVHMHEAHFRQDGLPGIPAGLSVHNVLQKEILSAQGPMVEYLPSICEAIPSTTNQDKPKYTLFRLL